MLRCKGVDLTGILGRDIKQDWESGGWKSPSGVQGLKLFCETTHNICIKKQQTTVAVTRVDILNAVTSKILGGDITMDVPLHKYWGDMSPLSHGDRCPC